VYEQLRVTARIVTDSLW